MESQRDTALRPAGLEDLASDELLVAPAFPDSQNDDPGAPETARPADSTSQPHIYVKKASSHEGLSTKCGAASGPKKSVHEAPGERI